MKKVASKGITQPPDTAPTNIRHLYRKEPVRNGRQSWETYLLNLTRKLPDEQMIDVYLLAERLAMARINAKLKGDRDRPAAARTRKRVVQRLAEAARHG